MWRPLCPFRTCQMRVSKPQGVGWLLLGFVPKLLAWSITSLSIHFIASPRYHLEVLMRCKTLSIIYDKCRK